MVELRHGAVREKQAELGFDVSQQLDCGIERALSERLIGVRSAQPHRRAKADQQTLLPVRCAQTGGSDAGAGQSRRQQT